MCTIKVEMYKFVHNAKLHTDGAGGLHMCFI